MEYAPEKTAAYLAGKIDEFVKQPARDTIMQNVRSDRFARYARIPDGKACDFCKMLGSRGFVYHSAAKAGDKGDQYHPFCNCQIAVSFDPKMQFYYKGWTKVSRGYASDGRVVRPGRDGSMKLRDVDIDELFAEYEKAGKSYTRGSRYRDYATGKKVLKLTNKQFWEFQDMLEGATTLEELMAADKYIVANWNPGSGVRDDKQWTQMRAIAKRKMNDIENLPNNLTNEYIGSEIVNRAYGFAGTNILEYEEYQAFDVNNNPIGNLIGGSAHHVSFILPEGYEWQEVRISHTHPSGVTFSSYYVDEFGNESGDIFAFTDSGAISIDVVTDDWIYTIERTGRSDPKGFLRAASEEERKQNRRIYREFSQEWESRYGVPPSVEEVTENMQELQKRISDSMESWYNKNADKYGYTYSKRSRNAG